ncbi:hypothetical protein [Antrihabitans cavernicola]|uniref:Uncharacterized protein n=1 Tax=Antrihabitans cavernicola TaxID=2495913 RepID=A0A5A7SIW3_9NOCA|nr:hypothetical protein [Spelaeibacter cavernicola]KAA0024667.1 hypothetical protein FOY51_01605 [Spelaeibacter cavernicola]
MADPKRVNFAYVGEPSAEWSEILRISAEVKELLTAPDARSAPRRREVPECRVIPSQDAVPLLEPELNLPFETDSHLAIRLTTLRVYASGVTFELVATDNTQHGLESPQAIPNLSFRIKPTQPHRIRLVLDLPDRTLLTNRSSQMDFPDEPRSPWLAGGSSYARRTSTGVEVGATYFLSPVPPVGTMYVSILYPEFDVERTNVEIDTSVFQVSSG